MKQGKKVKIFPFRLTGAGLGIAIALTSFLLFSIPDLEVFENTLLDYRFRVKAKLAPGETNPNLILVCIDDTSLQKIGHWPWPRSYHAQMVEILHQAGARIIVYDTLFTEPSRDPEEDLAFLSALRKSGNVHLPFFFKEDSTRPGLFLETDKVLPLLEFIPAAAGIWPINVTPDRDGIIRRMPLLIASEGNLYPALGFGLALTYLGLTPKDWRLVGNRLEVSTGNGKKIAIPVDGQKRMVINFAGDFDRLNAYPWETVFLSYFQTRSGEKPDIDLKKFKDKIVIVGTTATALGDNQPSPVNPYFPGLALHTTVISNILNGDFLVRPNRPIRVLILVFLGLVVATTVKKERLLRGISFGFLLLVIYIAVAFLLFHYNLWLDVASPTLTIFLASLTEALQNFFAERREKNFIRSTFQRYLAPEIVAEILSHSETFPLGGVRKKVTVLFADLRGFTRLSEVLPPEEVVKLLNETFEVITEAVFRYHGTLDKFIGDCAMALFGAPLPLPEQELMAVRAGMEIKDGVEEIAQGWLPKLGTRIGIGIGINTGQAVIGNIGSTKRMDYTAIGDTVNLAQRLEAVAEPGQILISETTFAPIKEKLIVTRQPPIVLKGKRELVVSYQVQGLKSI